MCQNKDQWILENEELKPNRVCPELSKKVNFGNFVQVGNNFPLAPQNCR